MFLGLHLLSPSSLGNSSTVLHRLHFTKVLLLHLCWSLPRIIWSTEILLNTDQFGCNFMIKPIVHPSLKDKSCRLIWLTIAHLYVLIHIELLSKDVLDNIGCKFLVWVCENLQNFVNSSAYLQKLEELWRGGVTPVCKKQHQSPERELEDDLGRGIDCNCCSDLFLYHCVGSDYITFQEDQTKTHQIDVNGDT